MIAVADFEGGQILFGSGGINHSANGRNAVGWYTGALGVFTNCRFVGSEVNAVHLIAGHIALQPLNPGAHSITGLTASAVSYSPLKR